MDYKDDDMGSTISSFSMVSVGGEELSAEVALDESCKDIQQGVNEIHSIARQMLMGDERDDTFEELNPLYEQLIGLIKEGVMLLKDLGKICKQIVPPKSKVAKKPSMLDSCSAK